jgi:hypothetical protein
VGNTFGDRAVASGGEVRPTNSGVGRTHESGSKVSKPMGVRVGIVIKIGYDSACGGYQARVASAAQTVILCANQSEIILLHNIRCCIGGPIVDDDYLKIWILHAQQAL